jgi:hypothetical protein
MKRSLIAVAALVLLLSSATYASPPRAPRGVRFFWGPVLAWFGFGHHHDGRMARHDEYGRRPPAYAPDQGYVPPGYRGRPYFGRGRHFGWQNGQHKGWDRHDSGRGDRRGSDGPSQGDHRNGRGDDHGRG